MIGESNYKQPITYWSEAKAVIVNYSPLFEKWGLNSYAEALSRYIAHDNIIKM